MRSASNSPARPAPPARRQALFAALAVLLSVGGCLVAAEIALRFLPVASGLRSVPVDAANPVFHFEPNRSYVYSLTWRMDYVHRGRVNNAGFVSDQDYSKNDSAPLIAVVGDSFVEAQMVPYPETMQGRLAKALAGQFRVYSFAASGAPISQYLIFAQHAVRDYGARGVVINVVVNDFDGSYIAYGGTPGFWTYVPDANGILQLRLQPLRHSTLRTLARHSALARYALINLRLGYYLTNEPWLRRLFFGEAHAQSPDTLRLERSHAVIDAFLRDLPRMVPLPRDRIVLTVDGFRYPDLKSASEGSYFDTMRKTLIAKAKAQGYEAIDRDPLFLARNRASGERFDFPTDPHWNGNGHAVAAEAVLNSRMLRALREAR